MATIEYSDFIKQKLHLKKLVLIPSEKQTDIWQNFSYVGYNDQEKIEEWAACNKCFQGFRTHKNGKNVGVSHLQRHLRSCGATSSKVEPKQTVITKFAYNKKGLSTSLSDKLKMAQLKYVVTGQHSYLCRENKGLLDLVQQCISIGNAVGNVNIRECWFGRKTIRETGLAQLHDFHSRLRLELQDPLKHNSVACTIDLWTDDVVKRSYLDFSIFWINDTFALKHSMARCKLFPYDMKTALNVKSEVESIMSDFSLPSGDTPITTDAGSIIKGTLLPSIYHPLGNSTWICFVPFY